MRANTLKTHLDVLDKKRQSLLKKLVSIDEKFVLSGGTALAMQLKHRKSYDFDFFSPKIIPKKLLEKLSIIVGVKNVAADTPSELTVFTKENVKVTFLHYPFQVYSYIERLNKGLTIFTVRGIALQKAYTIGRRGEYRDYFDIYSIITKGGVDLRQIIELAQKVYGTLFNSKLFLQQLVYFGDLLDFEIMPLPGQKMPSLKKIKRFFEREVRDYLGLKKLD